MLLSDLTISVPVPVILDQILWGLCDLCERQNEARNWSFITLNFQNERYPALLFQHRFFDLNTGWK